MCNKCDTYEKALEVYNKRMTCFKTALHSKDCFCKNMTMYDCGSCEYHTDYEADVGAMELALSALSKEVAKAPKVASIEGITHYYICPVCGKPVDAYSYCRYCGQKIGDVD